MKQKYFTTNTFYVHAYYKLMYNLTLFFKTPNQERSFNFPNTTLTKEVVQRLICTLTNEPIDAFHICYHDLQDEITLSIEEDYQNAIWISLQQTDISIFVATEREVKFIYMDDQQYRRRKDRHTSAKKKKGKKDKVSKATRHSRNILEKIEKIDSFNDVKWLDSEEIQIYKEQFQTPKGITSEMSSMQNNEKQLIADLNLGDLIDDLIQTSPILDIGNKANQQPQMKDNSIQPLSSDRSGQPLFENSLPIEENPNQRQHDKVANELKQMKEDIIREVVSRLPLYLKQQCFKQQVSQPKQKDPSTNIQPICSNCRKTLNAKDKSKWKKQVVSRQIKQIYPEREQTKPPYSPMQFIYKK